MGVPTLVDIENDDHLAEHFGHTKIGQQFCLTTPLTPSTGEDPENECRRYAAAHGLPAAHRLPDARCSGAFECG